MALILRTNTNNLSALPPTAITYNSCEYCVRYSFLKPPPSHHLTQGSPSSLIRWTICQKNRPDPTQDHNTCLRTRRGPCLSTQRLNHTYIHTLCLSSRPAKHERKHVRQRGATGCDLPTSCLSFFLPSLSKQPRLIPPSSPPSPHTTSSTPHSEP